MKKFWVLFKIHLQALSQYRADILVYTFSYMITPIIGLALWLSVSGVNNNLAYTKSEIIVYFLVVIVVELITSTWGAYFIAGDINNGNFSRYLIKPLSLINEQITQNLAEKFFKLFVVIISIFLLFFFFNKSYGLTITFSALNCMLFIFSVVLAFWLAIILDLIFGISTFWLHRMDGVRNFYWVLAEIFMGTTIPLAFMPGILKQLALLLPYRYMLSFPVEIILGKLTPYDLVTGFSLQLFWLTVFYFLYKLMYQSGIKRYQGYGS